MKSIAVLSSLALAGLSAAQFQGLPQCAQDCASQFFSGGIGNCGSDAKCICSNKSFLGDIACCLAKPGGCNEKDQSSAVAFASTICDAQGVTVPTAVSCTASQSGGSSSSGKTTGTPATNSAGTTSRTSSGGAQQTGASTSNTAASGANNPSSSSSKAWAPKNTAAAGGLLGGALAVAAML
ncbi:uncharacterized protein E0L32_006834 [Thyridium curvatum]|uniref:CFEM domain-containing protein n=1 Tax=Thyridium curvatum TaxID=1093900 RepID=A0A507AR03_9PEZI|nr:uncharacterized protein E0L32_006834 [Thyridium curvatum]TPX12422.1 hypothetical protein E0L32_006834 [Thyridium curvatum]